MIIINYLKRTLTCSRQTLGNSTPWDCLGSSVGQITVCSVAEGLVAFLNISYFQFYVPLTRINEAPGVDEVPGEIIKSLGQDTLDRILHLMQDISNRTNRNKIH